MISWLFLSAALAFASFGQVFFKLYSKKQKMQILFATIMFYSLTPISNYFALKELTMDVVYMATSLNSLIILILSHYFLEEKINKRQIYGAIIIFVGVVIYGVKL